MHPGMKGRSSLSSLGNWVLEQFGAKRYTASVGSSNEGSKQSLAIAVATPPLSLPR